MLSNFKDQLWLTTIDLKCVENGWQLFVELHVDNGTDDRNNAALRTLAGLNWLLLLTGLCLFTCCWLLLCWLRDGTAFAHNYKLDMGSWENDPSQLGKRALTVKLSSRLVSEFRPSWISNGKTLFTKYELCYTSCPSTGTSNAVHDCTTRSSEKQGAALRWDRWKQTKSSVRGKRKNSAQNSCSYVITKQLLSASYHAQNNWWCSLPRYYVKINGVFLSSQPINSQNSLVWQR